MKGYIYLIENNINHKKYIGKTYSTIEKRWKEHLKSLNKVENEHRPLYSAILIYGQENFSISEIEYVENCEEREKYWISFYNTFQDGYNATLGGDGRPFVNQELIIQLYNKTLSIREVSNLTGHDKSTISNILKNSGFSIPIGGNIYSDKKNWKAKKVLQYDMNQNYLNIFNSLSDAARWLIKETGKTTQVKHIVDRISKSIKNSNSRAYGYIWKYQED